MINSLDMKKIICTIISLAGIAIMNYVFINMNINSIILLFANLFMFMINMSIINSKIKFHNLALFIIIEIAVMFLFILVVYNMHLLTFNDKYDLARNINNSKETYGMLGEGLYTYLKEIGKLLLPIILFYIIIKVLSVKRTRNTLLDIINKENKKNNITYNLKQSVLNKPNIYHLTI